jgi:iron complex outermembrane receptor protein
MSSKLTVAMAALAALIFGRETPAAEPPAPGASAESQGLEEVVVTAERREESAQRAPIAISTLAGDDVINADVTRPEGLTTVVPALQVTDDTGPYSIFYVRGVGNFAANGLSDAALAFNFDGVTVSRSGTSGSFYDLERVEVLKGPQGTLYGRNATGGAINVITKAPVLDQTAAAASIEFGNYSAFRTDGMLNLPMGSTAALRVAAFHTQHDGYMKDGTDDQDDTGGRASLLLKPSDVFDLSVVTDFFRQGGQLSGGTVTGVTSSFAAPPTFSPSDRLGFFTPPVMAYIATQKDALNGANFLPFQNVNHEDNQFWGIESTLNWHTSAGTLTVVPAYRDSKLDYASFATGVLLSEQSHDKQTSLEARFASDDQQALRYVVGAFYLRDPNEVAHFNVNQQSNLSLQHYTATTESKAAFASLTYALVPEVRLTGGVRYTKDDKTFVGGLTTDTIICVFQGPTGPTCPNAGVFPYSQTTPVPPVFIPNAAGTITKLFAISNDQADSYSKVTWRGAVDWDLTDHNFLYASVESGFKSGGFFFSSDYDVFKPETITAYTVGSKNRFLDNRLQANIELYYWKYRDQQISHLSTDSSGDTIFPTENVGLATFKGVELDLQARPLQRTLLAADVQYNDGVYDSFIYHVPNNNAGHGNGTGCIGPGNATTATTYTVDCSGQQPPYAPRWTLSGSIEQTVLLPADHKLVGGARVHYQSQTLTALEFLPVEQQPGYAMWDFDLTYSDAHDSYFFSAYTNNAFDKTALSFSFATPFSNFMTATLQHPRTYGLRAGFRL